MLFHAIIVMEGAMKDLASAHGNIPLPRGIDHTSYVTSEGVKVFWGSNAKQNRKLTTMTTNPTKLQSATLSIDISTVKLVISLQIT